MSDATEKDIDDTRLQELKMKRLQHQIWEHKVRIASLLLVVVGTHLSGVL